MSSSLGPESTLPDHWTIRQLADQLGLDSDTLADALSRPVIIWVDLRSLSPQILQLRHPCSEVSTPLSQRIHSDGLYQVYARAGLVVLWNRGKNTLRRRSVGTVIDELGVEAEQIRGQAL